tara:strand:- start:2618 stop:3403 length:786 start_codon:yes stop_codon:yes gene_type:complete
MNEIISGFNDFIKALRRPDLWFYMAFFDVRMKYRRSYIGPWWETISSGLIIATLGFLWSKIFVIDITVYLPYFAVGFIIWSFITSQVNEACEIFYLHQNIILNIKTPYHSLLLRLAFKNGLILLHSLLILIPIIIYTVGLKLIFLYSLLGLAILLINLVFLSVVVAIFCLRFNDTKFAVGNLMQVLFFITPIVWMPSLLRGRSWVLDYNPIYHWINMIRDPIISYNVPYHSFFISLATILVLAIVSFYFLGRVERRIPFWY